MAMADSGRSDETSTELERAAAPAAARDDVRLRIFERGPSLRARDEFLKDFADEETFSKTSLASTLAPFPSHSSQTVARTRHPLVLVRVVDSAATPAPNVQLQLFDDTDTFLDAVATDGIGLGLLRFPSQPPAAGSPDLKGTLRIGASQTRDVLVPAGEDFVVVHVTLTDEAEAPGDEGARHDSVIPRLPVFFSARAADEIVRHRVTADGPDPCFAPAMERQCTYRAPQVRWIYTRRTAYQVKGPPRKLYVRLRQEWHYVGHSFGQPERIDSRDVASLVGSLDANLEAQLAVSTLLGVTTESLLTADASGRLRAAASLDGELDASVGLRLFEGGLGNPLSVSGDADVSIDTSLLVSAQLKLRASLRNQLHARASLSGRAGLGLTADASVSINPSLSRELNMPRFVIHQNWVVTTFVEDVQELREIEIFEDLREGTLERLPHLPFFPFPQPHPPLFPPADIVEYRPIFERQLLEPALAGRFRALRTALENAAGLGPLVRRLRFDITYSATGVGRFQAQVLGRSAAVKLTPSQSQARVAIDLPGGQFLDVLNGEKATFNVSVDIAGLIAGGLGSVRITSITAFSDASPRGQRITLPQDDHLEANASTFVDTLADVALDLPPSDAGLLTDPLVVHVNRNPTYYMGLLVKAARSNPSLRFDVPQLRRIGPDNIIWKVPIHGYAGNKALVLVPASGPEVDAILDDLGRSTVVQLAVDGNWTEAMQSENALADALGQLFPAFDKLELPLELLEGLTSGTGLVPAIVDAAGTAAGLGGAGGAVPGASEGALGAIAGMLDVP
jgi:hypothetical protein